MLVRTDPFRDLDRLAQQAFAPTTRPAAMPMDAFRLDGAFVLEVDLPGVDRDSIDVTVEKNVLTIHARRSRGALDGVEYLMGERRHGAFSRQLILGDSLDVDAIEATYDDGVLTVRIPVSERAKPRKIQIGGVASGPTAIDAGSHEQAHEPELASTS